MWTETYSGGQRNALIPTIDLSWAKRYVFPSLVIILRSTCYLMAGVILLAHVCIIRWQPAWSIRTALIALISFMPTEANGAIGSLDYPESYSDVQVLSALYRNLSYCFRKRRELAQKSISWECERCNKKNWDILAGTSPKQEKKSPAESTGKENERMQEVTQAADDCSLSKAARVDMPTTRDSESARTRPDLDARAGSVRHIVAPPVEVHPAARIRLLDAIIAAILLMLLAILCQKFVV